MVSYSLRKTLYGKTKSMAHIFNNREIASALWLLLFAIWVISKSEARAAFQPLIRAFLKWQILVPLLSMIAYVAIVVGGLGAIGFWDVSLMKDTVLWMLGFASIMLFRANKVDDREGFFRDAILNNLKLIAVLEFVSNAYTFSLWIELLLVPSLAFIAMLKTVVEFKVKAESSYRVVYSLLGYVLAFAGIVLIGIAIYRAIYDLDGFVTIHNLRDFLLPAVLSGLYLPFVYAWALFLAYEHLFVRIDIHNSDQKLACYLKKLVLVTFHVRLGSLLQWARWTSSLHVNNREDAAMLVKQSGASE